MKNFFAAFLLALLGLAPGLALAQEPLPPEVLTVEQRLRPGANVFVNHNSWTGAGGVNIYSADDLKFKGNISVGTLGQMVVVDNGDAAYVVSSYPRRFMSGPADVVLQRYEVATLAAGPEVLISDRFALTHPAKGIVAVTADRRFALIQNATPATSVTVVDLKTGKSVSEVPTPGCWAIIPAASEARFSTICGDGTLLTVKLNSRGRAVAQAYSAAFFDADKDPVFTHVERNKQGDLLFLSFSGQIYRVSDGADVAKLVDTFKLHTESDGSWAPGGYALSAYNAPNDVLFVLMHSDAKDGSHKQNSEEIWAIDLAAKQVLYRSPAKGFTHLAVNQAETPILIATSVRENKIVRLIVDPSAKFAAKPTHSITVPQPSHVVAP